MQQNQLQLLWFVVDNPCSGERLVARTLANCPREPQVGPLTVEEFKEKVKPHTHTHTNAHIQTEKDAVHFDVLETYFWIFLVREKCGSEKNSAANGSNK